jgi:hypothetical protein
MPVQALARLGKFDTTCGAPHQLHADGLLQLRQVIADVGAAHFDVQRGKAEIARFDDVDEDERLGGPCMGVKAQHHPARPSCQSRADATELCFPSVEATECIGEDFALARPCPAVAAKVVEIELVEHDGTSAHQMLALQVVVDKGRSILVLQRLGQLFIDRG